jgi:CDP-diacylglycerol--glycerol-3-phosphate 3-phosphatidyltransferase
MKGQPIVAEKKPRILTDQVRGITRSILDPIGAGLHRMHIHPDAVTIAGLVIVAIGAYFIAIGNFPVAVVLMIVALPLDAVDGAVARAMKRTGQFGAMLDSTLDRYADGFIFAALSYYFAGLNRLDLLMVAQAALLGSLLVSYTRARSDGLKIENKIGLFSRMERVVVIIIMLLIPALLEIGIWILAVGTNFTVLQRLWFVYRTLKSRGE